MNKLKITIQNSKILILTCSFAFLLFTFTFSFAQHEGHQPGGDGLASDSQSRQAQAQVKPEKVPKQKDVYYCPMHPSYTSDRPGDCPICNMKLVKRSPSVSGAGEAKDTEKELSQDNAKGFYVAPEKQQLIGVKVDKAALRSFLKTLSTVGRIAFDPELYKSQAEYIEALKTLDKVKEAEVAVIERISSLVEAGRLKLELSGLSKEQIEELTLKKENDLSLLVTSADTQIAWVYATIYEYELDYLRIGQEVQIKVVAYPAKIFKGEVVAIDPVFDTATRSVRARIKVENKDGLLKPNMFVDVKVTSYLGEKLAVPQEAVMDTGLRKIVFIYLPDGYFKPREVKTGVSADSYVEIVEGVREGEDVVISGNFLIDSESKLKSALEGASHQHGQ